MGKWFGHHLLAGMGDHWEQKSWNTTYTEQRIDAPTVPGSPEDATNYINRRTYIDLTGPVEQIGLKDFRETPLPGAGWVPKSAPSYNRYYLNAWMLATQSKFLNDRVVFTIGTRHDYLYSKLSRGGTRSPDRQGGYTQGFLITGAAQANTVEGSTVTRGVVVHATSWLSLLGNFSNNFALPALNQKTLPNNPVPQPRGETKDLGVQLNLLKKRLTARVVYYQTTVQDNSAAVGTGNVQDHINNIWNRLAVLGLITSAQRDQEIVSCNAYNYDNRSQGWEGEIVANVTPNWRLMANLATNKTSWTHVGAAVRDYLDAHRELWVASRDNTVLDQLLQTDNFVNPRFGLVEGTLLQSSPKWNGNLRTNYTFRGTVLKGISVGAGSRWRTGTILGYTSTDPATRQPIRSGTTTMVDANAGYRSRANLFNRNVGWSLQLNINNALNNDRIIPQTAAPDGSILNYRFQTPREWSVTSIFTF